jgi:hypothetical protein
MLHILEGGYNINQVANCTSQCLNAMLEVTDEASSSISSYIVNEYPSLNSVTVRVVEDVKLMQSNYWNCMKS